VKITRNPDGSQSITQLNVQLLLEGQGDVMNSSFTAGDNSNVVPTDTCKNTVYCIANQHEFKSMEEFGIILGKHFIVTYPDIVHKINISIKKDNWERLIVPDSTGKLAPHKHCFRRMGPTISYTEVSVEGNRGSVSGVQVRSGVKSLELLKTTQSGFVNFHKCKYTSLPEATDRLFGTSADIEWEYNPASVQRGGINYQQVNLDIENALIRTFTGPADQGIYSPSVQETLYQMGGAALKASGMIDQVSN
jgi:urate oxidase